MFAQNTGAALNVAKRLQVNLWVEPMESVEASRFVNPNGTVFPIMWLKEVIFLFILVVSSQV